MTFTSFVRGSSLVIGVILMLAPISEPGVRFLVGPSLVLIALLIPSIVSLLANIHDPRAIGGTFYWTGDLPDDEEIGCPPATKVSDDFGEQWQYQATQPVAKCVYDSVLQRGIATSNREPCADDHGWYVEFSANGRTCDLLLQWVPDGDRRDCFSFQTWYRHRLLPRKESRRYQQETLRETVLSILKASEGITQITMDRRTPESVGPSL